MASFCIPKKTSDELKEVLANGEFDVKSLYKMSEKERVDYFSQFTDRERVAKHLSGTFKTAIDSRQKKAFSSWINTAFTGDKELKKKGKKIVDEVNSPINRDTADATSIVERVLGIEMTAKDYAFAEKISKELKDLQVKIAGKGGDAASQIGKILTSNDKVKLNDLTDYFKKNKEIGDYIAKNVDGPTSVEILAKTVSPLQLLMSVKSVLSNVSFTVLNTILQGVVKRIDNIIPLENIFVKGGMRESGKLFSRLGNTSLKYNYIVNATKIRNATGVDVNRLRGFGVNDLLERQLLSEEVKKIARNTDGFKGMVQSVGKFYQDVVGEKLLGVPDSAFISAQFADSVDLYTYSYGKKAGLNKQQTRALLTETMVPNTNNPIALSIREQALADGLFSVYQNESKLKEAALSIRSAIDSVTGDVGGAQVLPFASIPSNAISQNLEWTGLGAIKGIIEYKGILNDRANIMSKESRKRAQEASRSIIRGGIGLIGAYVLVDSIGDQIEFVGAYDPARRNIDELSNVSYNAWRFKDNDDGRWYSVDYFGPLAVPVTAAMYAKNYNTGTVKTVMLNAIHQLTMSPFIEGTTKATETFSGVKDIFSTDKAKQEKSELRLAGELASFLVSRLVPAQISDISKLTDDRKRDVYRTIDARTEGDEDVEGFAKYANYFFEATIANFQSRVPYAKNELLEKVTVFGEPVPEETPMQALLTGARVRFTTQTEVTKEITRLAGTGEKINELIKAKYRRDKVGLELNELLSEEELLEFEIDFGKEAYEEIYKLMQGKYTMTDERGNPVRLDYINANNAGRAEMISDVYSTLFRKIAKEEIARLNRKGRRVEPKEKEEEDNDIVGTPVFNK